MTPTIGIHHDVPMGDYLDWDVASKSRLVTLAKTPAHLKAAMQGRGDTEAFAIGRAIHHCVLEPQTFTDLYTRADPCAAELKSGDRKGEPCGNNASFSHPTQGWRCGKHVSGLTGFDTSKVVLSHDDYACCMGIRDSASKLKAVRSLVHEASAIELSVVWPESETGVLVKGRLDTLSRALPGGIVGDVKSTDDASRKKFERDIFRFGYNTQGGLYMDAAQVLGIEARHFAIIAPEKKPPYAVAVYRLDEGALDAGIQQARPLLRLYQKCVDSGEWPAYPDEFTDISLPSYAWSVVDDEIRGNT